MKKFLRNIKSLQLLRLFKELVGCFSPFSATILLILTSLMEEALKFIIGVIISELRAQGHYLTGRLEKSIEMRTFEETDKLIGQILMESYGVILDKGVGANRIPYQRGSGAKKSKYIEALFAYVKLRRPSMGDKQALSFAFAIANAAKKTGHPLPGSYAFSQNNRRKNWAEHIIPGNEARIEQALNLERYVIGVIDNKLTSIRQYVV